MTTSTRFQVVLAVIFAATTLPVLATAQTDATSPNTVTAERVQLESLLRIGRADTAAKLTAAQWRAIYVHGIDNPFELLLANSDSLKLTDSQADSIAQLNVLFLRRANAVWAPVADYLAELPNQFDGNEAWQRVNSATVDELIALLTYDPSANALLTDDQLERLPYVMPSALSASSVRTADLPLTSGGPIR